MVVVSHLFSFSDKFREGMTRCESYPPCFRTIYFPTAPQEMLLKILFRFIIHTKWKLSISPLR